ncbi:MAG: hypothetical protein QOE82_2619 [Thermoanaerobaculia bacterium]|nr:hypothetical protein [Thermoanaerobaculia bacterium]
MPKLSAPRSLSEDIHLLEKMDTYREKFEKWREEARTALRDFVKTRADGDPADRWEADSDIGDKALVVKALCRHGSDVTSFEPLLAELRAQTLDDLMGRPETGVLFVEGQSKTQLLDAAYILDALAAAPKAVFAPATMICYYTVIREFYYAAPPLWVTGGARAGAGGRPSAFATSQFVRGVRSFARMIERTAAYLDALRDIQQAAATDVPAWDQQDRTRRGLSLYTTLAQRSWNLAFALDHPLPNDLNSESISTFESQIRTDLPVALKRSLQTFEAAVEKAKDYRLREKLAAQTAKQNHLLDRSEGAHAIALRALEDAVERARGATEALPETTISSGRDPAAHRDFVRALATVRDQFNDTAVAVRKLVYPSLDFLTTVLDRELSLAAADSGAFAFEASEMAAAAATLGVVGSRWADERLQRAAILLGAAVTPDGYNIAQPYHTGGGNYYQTTQPQIFSDYAQVIEHVGEVSLPVLDRIQHYFDQKRVDFKKDGAAWRWAHSSTTGKLSPYHSAVACLAFERLTRMLEKRINEVVLGHFNYRKPEKLKVNALFFPDYGLVIAEPIRKEKPRMPIAVALERMRAHVSGVNLVAPYREPFYSAVFYGPPGTGKTKLLEALAASCEVPLIEVTPGDIVVRGIDQVEARARDVLRALSFVTRAVILFDEFDQVLKTREQSQARDGGSSAPPSMLSFLTPSMLPKLKVLYESAKSRRVAYALATNRLKDLDDAAIRPGRFDQEIGVYPPDAVSRYGRLYSEVREYLEESRNSWAPQISKDEFAERFKKTVLGTKDASMQEVGGPGWFTRPREEVERGTIFGYLFLEKDDKPPFRTVPVDRTKEDDPSHPEEKDEQSGEKKKRLEDEEKKLSREEKFELKTIRKIDNGENECGQKVRAALDRVAALYPNS